MSLSLAGFVNPTVVENHRQHAHRLTDRLLLEAGRVEFADEIGDHLCVDSLDGGLAETGEKPAERDLVRLQSPSRDIDT